MPRPDSSQVRFARLAAFAEALTSYQEQHSALLASIRSTEHSPEAFDRRADRLCKDLKRLKRWKMALEREKSTRDRTIPEPADGVQSMAAVQA